MKITLLTSSLQNYRHGSWGTTTGTKIAIQYSTIYSDILYIKLAVFKYNTSNISQHKELQNGDATQIVSPTNTKQYREARRFKNVHSSELESLTCKETGTNKRQIQDPSDYV